MISDPVGDFLARIRNAQARKKENVSAPSTKMLVAIADILKKEGFITDFEVEKRDPQDDLIVTLKYVDGQGAIRDMKRMSKPGIRRYRGYRDIKPVMRGLGISIFTTPKGVLTGKEAKEMKLGGEYLCEVY